MKDYLASPGCLAAMQILWPSSLINIIWKSEGKKGKKGRRKNFEGWLTLACLRYPKSMNHRYDYFYFKFAYPSFILHLDKGNSWEKIDWGLDKE